MRLIFLLLITFLICGCLAKSSHEDPDDLVSFIEEVRNAGMTDSARNNLRTVAVIYTNQSTLTFIKDDSSGAYFPSYRSNTCAVPGTDPKELERIAKNNKEIMDAAVKRIRPVADTDSSGFVSTTEAIQFRDLFEFGIKVKSILQSEGQDEDGICAGIHLSKVEFHDRVNDYNEFLERARQAGVDDFAVFEIHDLSALN